MRTDGHGEANSRFSLFYERAFNTILKTIMNKPQTTPW
jgi:hypothetical protein